MDSNNSAPPTEANNGTSTMSTETKSTHSSTPHTASAANVEEEQFALVADPATQETMELPTNAGDNTLLVSVLERAIPTAHGLRYKNPATGAMRVLKMNEEGTRFYPPTAVGWGNIVLSIIPKPTPPPTQAPAITEPTGPQASAAVAESKPKIGSSATIITSVAAKQSHTGTTESGNTGKRGESSATTLEGVAISVKESTEGQGLSTSPPAGKKRKSETVAESDERDEHEEDGDGEEEGEEDGSVHLIDEGGDADEVEEVEEKEATGGANEPKSNESTAPAKKANDSSSEGVGPGAKRQRGKRANRAAAWKAKMEAEGANAANAAIGPSQAASAEKKCTDLIVLGLTHSTTTEEIRAYFEQFGSVVMCELKMGNRGTSRGFGFIHMAKYADQQKILHHPNHNINGKIIEVHMSTPKADRDVSPSVRSKKLFIGRLPDWMKAERMRDFFFKEAKKIEPTANVVDVYIPKPFRNFGFVTFNSSRVVRELSRQIDFIVDGSSLSVSIAEPKVAIAAKKARVDDAPYMRPRSPERFSYGNNRRGGYNDAPMRNSNRFDRYVEPEFDLPPMRGGGGRGYGPGPDWAGAMPAMDERYSQYSAMDPRVGGGSQRAMHPQSASGYSSYQPPMDVAEQLQVRQQMLAIQHQLQHQTGGMAAARSGSPGGGFGPGPERGGGANPAHQLSAAIGDPSLANMNPEVVNAALKAFWSVARSGGAPNNGGPAGGLSSSGNGGGGAGGGHYPPEDNWDR